MALPGAWRVRGSFALEEGQRTGGGIFGEKSFQRNGKQEISSAAFRKKQSGTDGFLFFGFGEKGKLRDAGEEVFGEGGFVGEERTAAVFGKMAAGAALAEKCSCPESGT